MSVSRKTLPTFVVIGAAKSGTTSLHRYLKQHPEVFVARRREPSFFAHEGERLDFRGPGDDEWNFVTDLLTYQDLFTEAEGYRAVGEISPRYLFFERAPARIKHHIPEAHLVAILRHPVDRAYSHFLMNRDRRCEPEADFSRAIERGPERAALGWGWDWQYAGAGRYYEQLRRYYDLFPSEQIQVFLYDDFRHEPDAFYRDLFTFLGVDPSFRPDMSVQDRTAAITRSPALKSFLRRPSGVKALMKRVLPPSLAEGLKARVASWNAARPDPLPPIVRQDLFDRHFADDCARLEGLIGRDLSLWTSAASHASTPA